MATRLSDLGGVQWAVTSHILTSFAWKGMSSIEIFLLRSIVLLSDHVRYIAFILP